MLAVGNVAVLVAVAAVVLPAAARVEAGGPKRPSTASGVVDLVFAAVLFGLGIVTILRRNRPRADKERTAQTGPRPFLYVGIGVAAMVTNVSSLALYVPAVKEIGMSSAGTAGRAVVFAVLVTFVLLPTIAPLGLALALPSRSAGVLDSINAWVHRHSLAISLAIELGFGAYLAFKGLRIIL